MYGRMVHVHGEMAKHEKHTPQARAWRGATAPAAAGGSWHGSPQAALRCSHAADAGPHRLPLLCPCRSTRPRRASTLRRWPARSCTTWRWCAAAAAVAALAACWYSRRRHRRRCCCRCRRCSSGAPRLPAASFFHPPVHRSTRRPSSCARARPQGWSSGTRWVGGQVGARRCRHAAASGRPGPGEPPAPVRRTRTA